MFSSRTPHFVMIVQERTIRDERLWIPKKFSDKYGGILGDTVHLKLPCGTEWKMKLSRQKGNSIELETGWPEFAKHYSLERGHVLVFSYQGDSRFNLLICKSLVEIDYPITQPKPEPREYDSSEIPRPLTRPSTLSSHLPEVEKRDDELAMKPLRGNERIGALEKDIGFKSNRPFFLIFVSKSPRLNGPVIPTKFAKKYLTERSGFVRLIVSNEMTWSVKYICHHRLRLRRSSPEVTTRFGRGWSKFAQDNNLKPNDICEFLLIKRSPNMLFEVEIFRGNDDGASISRATKEKPGDYPSNGKTDSKRGSENEKEREVSEPNKQLVLTTSLRKATLCRKPSFETVITKSYASSYLSVPRYFVEMHIKKESDTVLLCNGVPFGAKLCAAGFKNSWRITPGWVKFAKGNKLKVGDVCIFELVDRAETNVTFKVSIRRSRAVV